MLDVALPCLGHDHQRIHVVFMLLCVIFKKKLNLEKKKHFSLYFNKKKQTLIYFLKNPDFFSQFINMTSAKKEINTEILTFRKVYLFNS